MLGKKDLESLLACTGHESGGHPKIISESAVFQEMFNLMTCESRETWTCAHNTKSESPITETINEDSKAFSVRESRDGDGCVSCRKGRNIITSLKLLVNWN